MESFDLNKMEQQLAYPPQINDAKGKTRHFPIFDLGGGKSLFSENAILLFFHERVASRDARVLKLGFISFLK